MTEPFAMPGHSSITRPNSTAIFQKLPRPFWHGPLLSIVRVGSAPTQGYHWYAINFFAAAAVIEICTWSDHRLRINNKVALVNAQTDDENVPGAL
eukprot:m.205475 g.205475  ORF g.205475 m.205475 type:complete len:95 (+) comp25326_c0_seq5:2740-3024(+)